jgi:hypothetical protein
LRKALALLGALVPEPRDIRGSLLDAATAKVTQSTLQALDGTHFAIVMDGWSKRTAAHGKPLINVIICPYDGPAVAWRIVDASEQIKDTAYAVQLHRDLRGEIEAAVPNGHFLGYVMDSTATNRAAMRILQQEDRTNVVVPCVAHALSNVIKHAAKNFV